jgi:LuxR family maltose regulon positive regulatory protein
VEENGDEEHLAIYGKLSGREIEILDMVASGMLNRQIGEKLGLTEGTVKWYLQQIFDKVGVRNRKQAVARARRLGILSQAN